MRVAMLSWRDLSNPEAGGAERYLTQVATGLAARGHKITVFTARHPGSRAAERRDGVDYRRQGGKLSVYPRSSAAMAMDFRRRGRDAGAFDVVVDVQNGVPFLSRLATRVPVVVLVHHVHREQWPVVYGHPMADLGWWVESRLAPAVYRGCQYVTVSERTKADLTTLGVDPAAVAVVHNGTDPPPPASLGLPRDEHPRLITLGRLVPHKQVEHALLVTASLRRHLPVSLDVVGGGWWAQRLHEMADRLGVRDAVTFHGQVDEATKHRLLASAWVQLLPSLKEGWGLSVMEAATHRVPTISYRSSGGTSESIVDASTGVLVEDLGGMLAAAEEVLTNAPYRTRLGEAAAARALSFTWEATIDAFEKVLLEQAGGASRR